MPDSTRFKPSRVRFPKRMRRPLRAPAAFVALLAILATAVPALAAAGGSASSTDQPTPPFTGDPAFADAWQRSQSHQAQAGGPQQRQVSASAYQDQSASEALATAKQEQPEVVLAPAWQSLSLTSGAQVEQYLGAHAARVDVPGEPSDVIVQSTLPMRSQSGSGQDEPVDLTLIHGGDGFEPENPLVATRIAERADQPTELSDIGVSVSAVGASADSLGREVADKVFYANAYTDSDVLVRPLPTGAETLFEIRSAASPQRFAVQFELPAGADLVAGSKGQDAQVVRGGQVLATVPRSIAWDADQRPVPVTARVDGRRLSLEVNHQGGDWAYPILLDPSTIVESASDFTGWRSVVQAPSGFYNAFTTGLWGTGLYTVGYDNHWYNAGDWAAWVFDAPGATAQGTAESFIYRADFTNVSFIPTVGTYDWSPLMRAVEGIWSTQLNQWEAGTPSQPSPVVLASSYDYYSTNHCLASGCGPTKPGNLDAGTRGNKIYLETWSPCSCYTAYPGPQTYMGGAAAWIADRIAPSSSIVEMRVRGALSNPPSEWVDAVDLSVVTKARDRGLGVKSFRLSVPGRADLVRSYSCSGALSNPCPNDASDHRSDDSSLSGPVFAYSTADGNQPMPDGLDTVTATATDAVGNVSTTGSWQLKVDHSAPTLALEGSLAEHQGQALDPGVYRFQPVARDPYSGVKRIEVFVDGRSDYAPPAQDCDAARQCPKELRGDYQFVTAAQTPGQHEIRVEATDATGHKHTDSFTVTTDYSAECPGVFLDPDSGVDPQAVESCPQPNPNTFEGNCSVDGQTSYTQEVEGFILPTTYLTINATGTGDCSGSLNLEPISHAPIRLTLRDDYTCSALSLGVDTHTPSGAGSLTFTNGTSDPGDDVAITLSYRLTGSQRTTTTDTPGASGLQLSGVDGGTAAGALTLAQHSWGGCSPRADSFDASFQTVNGLHDEP